ncbi:MAG TPA: hypothetical protein VFB80_14445 [Pirellulaceae bacterium]|nr:hypothetical protein [Pirellulaceae bacterium]
MPGEFFPDTNPQAAASPPPAAGSRWWIWLLAIGGFVLISPFCCCGGLIVAASTYKDFALSNGQHLGGPPMNVRFDYEIRNDRLMFDTFYIVCKSADGTSRERNLAGSFAKRGTLHFNAFDLGPASTVRGPVQVWIEKADMRGGRSRASNVLTIYTKT